MCDRAETYPAPFVALQYCEGLAVSFNCVPPTAIVYGVDASTFTERPYRAVEVELGLSQSAEPESPLDTRKVMPCAAACWASELMAEAAPPFCASHAPKLAVMMSARLLLTT